MKQYLRLESLPYFLTMLLVLVGWSFSRVVDAVYESPTLEYNVQEKEWTGDTMLMQIVLRNISRDRLFKDAVVKVSYPDGKDGNLEFLSLIAVPPAARDSIDHANDDPDFIDYKLPQIQPGSTYRLLLAYAGDEPDITFSSPEAVRFKEASLETALVRYELTVNLSLIFLWLVIILIYVWRVKPEAQSKDA